MTKQADGSGSATGAAGGGSKVAALLSCWAPTQQPKRTWIALKDSDSEFSLQNCRIILITLHKDWRTGLSAWSGQKKRAVAPVI